MNLLASGRGLLTGRMAFRKADSAVEMEAIHRLNYSTFVQEIGQYPDMGGGRLVDRFHERNTYYVAYSNGHLVGMVAVQDVPPFSITARLPDERDLYRDGPHPLEVRLLAITPGARHRRIIAGLLWAVLQHARGGAFSHFLISAVEERLLLYTSLGFQPLAPAVPSGNASFTPMSAPVAQVELVFAAQSRTVDRVLFDVRKPVVASSTTLNLLPGPAELHDVAGDALRAAPSYHRDLRFIERFERARAALRGLTGASRVAILPGGGTLANDIAASAIAKSGRPVLVLENGEFGRRLSSCLARLGLHHRVARWAWGQPWNLEEIARLLNPEDVVWGVHLETSTGVLNDLQGLQELASRAGVSVVVDCVSSLGGVPVDLTRVALATGVSGKCFGSLAGLALVFGDAVGLPATRPGLDLDSLDLDAAFRAIGPLHTVGSQLVDALLACLERYGSAEKVKLEFQRYAMLGAAVRAALLEAGLQPLAPEGSAAPVVTTFRPWEGLSGQALVAICASCGIRIGGEASYLVERGWCQVATMGQVELSRIEELGRLLLRTQINGLIG